MVTKASVTTIGIVCSFEDIYAVHFENVNEPYGVVSIKLYLYWQNELHTSDCGFSSIGYIEQCETNKIGSFV